MEFMESAKLVKNVLEGIGSIIDPDAYDGFIVKLLKDSNTLDANRTTKQSHIAITGDQMDMFPYIQSDGYLNTDYDKLDADLKKYFVAQIPVYLHKENIEYLSGEKCFFEEDERMVYVSIVRSRRNDAADQIQMSMTYMDSPEFITYRKMVHAGSYMIILKRTETLAYDMYCVKESDIVNGVNDLASINNSFYKLPTSTVVRIDEIQQSEKSNRTGTNDDYENEYQRAALYAKNYALENGIDITSSEEAISSTYAQFQQKFSPDRLASLSDDELRTIMFYSLARTNDSLCYWLEVDKDCKEYMGSISGGSAYKFGLFQNKDTGIWMSGSPAKPQELSDEEALKLAKQIRDALVNGANLIKNATLESVADYEALDDSLMSTMGPQIASWSWVHKYFSMIFPDKLSSYHSSDWQRHVLYAFRIKPSEKLYARSGQIAMIQKYNNWVYHPLARVAHEAFGRVKTFLRLGSTGDGKSYADIWRKRSIVGIGWKAVGDLTDYVTDKLDKKSLADKLQEIYYPEDSRTASRKAGEMQAFYESGEDTVFIVMNGQTPIALVDEPGPYTYDSSSDMAHIKKGKWHNVFREGDALPFASVGMQTTCYEIDDEENLMYLYEKYYYGEENEEEQITSGEENMIEYTEPIYKTSFTCPYDLNRIVFGAPGTGKSHLIKRDSNKLLENGGGFERVTFHPDYTYSQFVGTYKPVTDQAGHIEYNFVPGPFMRVYVNAIKSGKTDTPLPYLLIVEEINRAKVAAVFGDVFQLLDRDDDGVSEYEIQPSEDVRKYLARELGGNASDYLKMQLPNNMLIWATMNSADQGVFPMDTAFKRRWGFDYLGINENEDEITGHVILGQGDDERDVEWNTLRKAINEKLTTDYKINEDKLLGPFFLEKKYFEAITGDNYSEESRKAFIKVFKSKVIMYLFEDAAKQHKHKLFENCSDTTKYSSICNDFDRIGIKIFGETFENDFYNPQKEQ